MNVTMKLAGKLVVAEFADPKPQSEFIGVCPQCCRPMVDEVDGWLECGCGNALLKSDVAPEAAA